jgi:ankyrin repeat protein
LTTLFEAIERADAGTVWQLAKDKSIDVHQVDEVTEMTPLALAAESGQEEIVRTLLDAGADPNVGGATSPLEAAVVEGHVAIVQALIEAGADVNQAVEDGFTPLMTAATTGDVELVELLLDAGARPRKRNDEGQTAISLADEAGHDDVVEALRAASRRRREADKAAAEEAEKAREAAAPAAEAEERAATAEEAREPAAGEEGEPEAEEPGEEVSGEDVAEGAEAGAEIAEVGAETTAAETAPRRSRDVEEEAAEAKKALDQAAEEAAPVGAPRSAADAAAEEAAAAVESEFDRFNEPLAELKKRIEEGADDAVASFLEGDDLDLEARDDWGRTPLMAAAYLGDPKVVRALLAAGAAVGAADDTDAGETALVYAVKSLSPERNQTVEALVEAGADVDRRCGRNQRTPLMHAAEADVYLDREPHMSFALTTKKLLELGADVHAKDRKGNTVWRLIKRDALGARTSSVYRRRLHQMLRVLEHAGAEPIASHQV